MNSIVPTYDDLMNPVLQALRTLGGSGSNDEIFEKVSELLELSEEVLAIPHKPERDSRSEVEYRLAWARTYLKKCGIIDNSSRGVWAITLQHAHTERIDPYEAHKREKGVYSPH